jgi:predicted DNA-binding transcriptional regulator YafY
VNRIDRVSAILIQLQSKKFVTAEEIATRFEISKRTAYRDLKALEEAGVPVGAEPGKGYFLIDGYHLPPVMFTTREASSLLTAEKIVEKIADKSVNEQYKSAMYKIKAVLPEKEKQYLDRLGTNIEILHFPPAVSPEAPNNYILDVQHALVNKKVLKIDYRAGYNEELVRNRLVEPVGLCFYSMGWHLIGFCRFRNDYRDFRLDRIYKLTLTDELYQTREIKSVKEFFKRMQDSYELEQVVVRFPKTQAKLIQTTRYYYGFIAEEENGHYVDLTFVVNDTDYFIRWMMMYSDVAEILSPEKHIEAYRKFINSVKKRI